jgi:hypothetical protein
MANKTNKYVFIIITIICFVLYGNTLSNKYALDDTLVFTGNSFTKAGFKGLHDIFAYDSFTGFFGKDKNLVAGGRYRPLSLASFALEVEMFGQSPAISHFINIILYIVSCILLFLLLQRLLPDQQKRWYLSIAFIATILFLIHPVHTEVVANIKGRDEMMTLIGALGSFILAISIINEKKTSIKLLLMTGSFFSFFLALLSKENAITFLAIIPCSLYIFNKADFKQIVISMLAPLAASILFLYIRHNILGDTISAPIMELMNNPFVHATTSQKYATIFYTLGIYIKLLFWPHPLTFDYYPYHIALVNWSNPVALISVIIYIALSIYMVWAIVKKQFNGFSALIYLASLSIVSNLLFPIGTFMNERFVFIASIGFVVTLAYLLVNKLPLLIKNEKIYFVVTCIIFTPVVVLSSYKIIDRNRAWKDDLTLFTTDVHISFNSAKSTCSAGGKLYESALVMKDSVQKFKTLDQSLIYLHRAVAIHPVYTDALLLLGNCLFEYKMYDSMLYYYKRIVKTAPFYQKVYENLPLVVNKFPDVDKRIKEYEYFYAINKYDYDLMYQLGTLYGREKHDLTKAIYFLERAYTLNPSRKEATKDLGVAYGMSGKAQEAITLFEKALQYDPSDPQIYYNLSISYRMLGKEAEAAQFLAKSEELKQKVKTK